MTHQGESTKTATRRNRRTGEKGSTSTRTKARQRQAKPARNGAIKPVTRRGRLVLAPYDDTLELQTRDGRFELLGPYGTEAHEGDRVEVVGLPDPTNYRNACPALLIQQMRRIA